jgi:hypothetical protein
MDRKLIEVYVPAISESFDIFVPNKCIVYDLLILISQTIANLSSNRYVHTKNSMLCYRENGRVLDINSTAEEAGIENGLQLLLI